MSLSPQHTPPDQSDDIRDAATLDSAKSHLHAGQVIANRYEVLTRLGRGQMGEVWRAYDLKLRVDVALKLVRRITPNALEDLRSEVRIARDIVSPNVCRVYDLIVAEGQEFLSMEYIDGQTLLALLKEKSPLRLPEAREIASQFLAGLQAIHQAGIVHRDLKPENIMITRTGRAVVMDFGIAKPETQHGANISGTPPYMAPEQFSSVHADAKFDLFAAGIVLAEMISPIQDTASRKALWNGCRADPPRVPAGAWQAVIAQAVAKNPDQRFHSALALSTALEEATRRIEIIEEAKPYPGLSAFTQEQAKYFFGRDVEIETVLKRLQELHLMAIVGPSGAGKTSFLGAGLIPTLPTGWNSVLIKPGDAPLKNLGQALALEFSGDPEAIRKMVRLDDTEIALWLLHRWRQNHSEAVLIIDQFEELFTLNDGETQTRFAQLLGQAALAADIRVLLSLRDDFLIFCKERESLSPIFSDLTVLLPLSGAALKRALIKPALKCGCRFEDEELVTEILEDVQKERGALPLMAFATARLWEKRDRENGLILRAAYNEIGGVAGALAQHAEATMERIGTDRKEIVREIFRNLVTAQKTRAVRDAEELLSIFKDRKAAEEVLRILIDARLLTSFEPSQTDGTKTGMRVEIIHESLLSAWPRLVRWQTQDADNIQFRDQLFQTSRVWNERGRPADLLWTGSSYKEFEVWREQYSGGLTAIEKEFADAMLQQAQSQRLKRRTLLFTIFIILLSVIASISFLWKSEKSARQAAVSEANRAEASKLLTLGRTELDDDPTIALAYATASLERADSQVARRFAMQALWKGPPLLIAPMPVRPVSLDFSPNDSWIAVSGFQGARLLAQDGKRESMLARDISKLRWHHSAQFSPNRDLVVWISADDLHIVRIWSVSKGREIQQFQMEGATSCLVRGGRLILMTDMTGNTTKTFQLEKCRIRVWSFNKNAPRIVGQWNLKGATSFDISSDAERMAYVRGRSIFIRPLEGMENASETLVGEHDRQVTRVIFHPNGKEIASADVAGEIRMWSLRQNLKAPIQIFAARGSRWNPDSSNVTRLTFGLTGNLFFNSSGSIFAAAYPDKTLCLWDLKGPSEADPIILRRNIQPPFPCIAFDHSYRWAVVNYADHLAFWPLAHSYPYVLHGEGDWGASLAFLPDGKQLAAAFGHGAIHLWHIDDLRTPARQLLETNKTDVYAMDADPTGKVLAIAGPFAGRIISIADGTERNIPGIGTGDISFSGSGRLLAGESYGDIPLLDLASNKFRILKGKMKNYRVRFAGENLFSSDQNGNVYKWDLKHGTNKWFAKGNKPLPNMRIPREAPYLLICLWTDREEVDIREYSSELRVFDLRTRKSYPITTHGNRVISMDVDPSGKMLVTGDADGAVRVGPITGEAPYLLLGHQCASSVAIDPQLRWIASSECQSPVVRLWPMPKGKPFHTLPYNELLKRLHGLTNVRVVADVKSSTGYRIQFDPFPGWQTVPNW